MIGAVVIRALLLQRQEDLASAKKKQKKKKSVVGKGNAKPKAAKATKKEKKKVSANPRPSFLSRRTESFNPLGDSSTLWAIHLQKTP